MEEDKKNIFLDKFVEPSEIVGRLEVAVGSAIADFGCGSGYFSIPFAKLVGEDGRVFALDVLPSAISAIESQAKIQNLSNISAKRVNLEKENGSGLESASVDWVVMKDVLFQNGNKEIILNEAKRILKPAGKILIMEWSDDGLGVGPEMGMRIPLSTMRELAGRCGFSIENEDKAGGFHYIMIGKKN